MNDFTLSCPIPIDRYPHVTLAHGGGGKLMNQLIEDMFAATFSNEALDSRHDGAVLTIGHSRLAFSTDSYVVKPIFFAGGDIGSLAVHGTVNDLAMCGAKPMYLSCGFILEEGLPMDTLWRVVQSMQHAATAADITFVTGDTKVVDRGKGDGIFINTAGIGALQTEDEISPASVKPGDSIVISGDIGRHGIAIMAEREGISFETSIESDSAPVVAPVMALLEAGIQVHCMRDLTRGGLASALVEIAQTSSFQIEIDESVIPVQPQVKAACEILGLDPMYVANEGRFIVILRTEDESRALDILKQHSVSENAGRIGRISDISKPLVTLKSRIGANRIVDMMSGEQLPRIC